MLTAEEIAQHNSRKSCWVIIAGQAYDVTDYVGYHPGGANTILRYAGQDATEEYRPVHPPGTIEKTLPKEKHLGPVDVSSKTFQHPPANQKAPARQSESQQTPLPILQNLDDFEHEAKKVLAKKAWIYFSSGADSLASIATNREDWSKISLRPRILRNVAKINTRRKVLGHESSLPIFIAPAALARLGHEDGELCLTRGAARHNIVHCPSTYSSIAHADLAQCLKNEEQNGALAFQLYVPIVKHNAKKLISEARRLGYKALVITVDSAVIGKREEDDRHKAELDHAAGVEVPRTTSADFANDVPVLRGAHSSTFEWEDLVWISEEWQNAGPIVLKGIQTVEDAVQAAQAGVQGIYLSNHGGRQLDHAPSSVRTLLEIRTFAPQVLQKLDVYLDGGIRRGTDVVKALCLGATAVGLGRPFMYSLSGYGTAGVCRAIEILRDEIETTLRLMGVTDLSQLNDYYVNTSKLELEMPKRVDLTQARPNKL